MTEEIIVGLRSLTKGYIRMAAIDFGAWNNAATVKYIEETGDVSCTSYTSFRTDNDSAYVWARVEHDFITDLPLVSYEDAITQGMRIGDENH